MNSQKGFAVPLAIVFVILLVIFVGLFVYRKAEAPAINTLTSPPAATTSDQTNLPIINKITPNSGPKGTVAEISGKNLSGFEGDLNVYFERTDGKTVLLTDTFGDYAQTGGSLIKVKVAEPCQPGEKVIGEYSGIESVCDYVELTPGAYQVYTEPWGVKSNAVDFEITK